MEVSDFEEGRLEDALTHGPGLCPRCHEHAAGFDYLQGLSVCEACGHVLQDEELVSQVLFVGKEDQKPAGVIVGSKDSGLEASLRMLRGTRVGTAVHRTRPKNSAIHVAKTVKEISNKMHLSSSVASEAELYMEKVLKAAHGSWRLELVAASAVYMAIRQNNVPLTLLDLADATHQNLYALGRYYRLAIRMLDIHPPPIRVADHLHRALARYYASTSVQKGVENDATEVLHWMEEQFIEGSRHPLVMLGVAILVSLEMNNQTATVDKNASCLRIGADSLSNRLGQVKERMYLVSRSLPYAHKITPKNVASHAKIIIKLTNIFSGKELSSLTVHESKANRKRKISSTVVDVVCKQKKTAPSRVSSQAKDTVGPSEALSGGDDGHHQALGDDEGDEVNEYIRTPEEVALYAALYEASERAR